MGTLRINGTWPLGEEAASDCHRAWPKAGHTDFLQRHICKLQPASSPVARCLVIDIQLASNLQGVPPIAGARKANCCSVVKACTKRSKFSQFPFTNTAFGGLGVAIVHSGHIKMA